MAEITQTRLAALLSCLIFFAAGSSAAADEIHLKNGDYISGYIVSIDEETVVIRTSYGELTIDRSQVLSGTFTTEETISLEGLEIELLFGNDTSFEQNSNLTIIEHGVVPATGADGLPDSAIRSSGDGNYIELSGSPGLDSADNLTVSFWIYPKESERLQYVFSKWDVSTDGEADGKFAVGFRNTLLYIYLMDPDRNYHFQSFENAVPAGKWTHLAVVLKDGLTTVYQNGALLDRGEVPVSTLRDSSVPLYVMTAKASTEDRWSRYNLNGMLDNLRIYSRALGESEIADLASEL